MYPPQVILTVKPQKNLRLRFNEMLIYVDAVTIRQAALLSECCTECAGNSTSENGAGHCLDGTLKSYKQYDEKERIGCSESGSDPLDIVGVIKEQHERTHEEQGI